LWICAARAPIRSPAFPCLPASDLLTPRAPSPFACRWRDSGVDPGAELDRVAACLPRLAQLTLPGEWAVGWAAPAPATTGRRRGHGPPPATRPAAPDLAATPLARLLLACRGRAGAPAVRVSLPTLHGAVTGAEERWRGICEAAMEAASGRAEGAGEGMSRPDWARLPRVECFGCDRDGSSSPG
jgi:hypothetical protein